MSGVAPDGSPVAVYLALGAEADLGRLRPVLRPGSTVLDLGSGPGRLTNPLAAAGHTVVAVDDSAEMLAHVVGAETVLADVWDLHLGRRFDVVLALSHLVNDRSRTRRAALMDACVRHLVDGGRLVVQRYPPTWRPSEGERAVGRVGICLHDVVDLDDGFAAAVTYTLEGRSWTQRFDAVVVDDAEVDDLAAAVGLAVTKALDEERAWLLLERVGGARAPR